MVDPLKNTIPQQVEKMFRELEGTYVTTIASSITKYLDRLGHEDLPRISTPGDQVQGHDPNTFYKRKCFDYLAILPNSAALILEVKMLNHLRQTFKSPNAPQRAGLILLQEFGIPIRYAYDTIPKLTTYRDFKLVLQHTQTETPKYLFALKDIPETDQPKSLLQLLDDLLKDDKPDSTLLGLLEKEILGSLDSVTTSLLICIYHEHKLISFTRDEWQAIVDLFAEMETDTDIKIDGIDAREIARVKGEITTHISDLRTRLCKNRVSVACEETSFLQRAQSSEQQDHESYDEGMGGRSM